MGMLRAATSLLILIAMTLSAAELPTRKTLNLAAIRTMVAAAEAEITKRNVAVTICIVDDAGNLLFLQRGDGTRLNTVEFAQRKARHGAIYGRPSKAAADRLKQGELEQLAFPGAFPNQGGLPILLDGQILGGIGISGAPSEVDEAIGQIAIDALLAKLKP